MKTTIHHHILMNWCMAVMQGTPVLFVILATGKPTGGFKSVIRFGWQRI